MGGTLGRNSDDTANILGALQLLIQMHALSISASLFQIARQWLLGSLLTLNRGIPLGLVGAERQMGSPSFVISHGYLSAAKYSVSLWWGPQTRDKIRRKWNVGLLTAFLFVSCILSVLAAPASGVLMIPRVYWFLDSTNDYDVFVDGENTYPYIMLPPQLYYGNPYFSPHSVSFNPFSWAMENRTTEYWQQISSIGQQNSPTTELLTGHQVPTADGITFVNTTTTWGRKMDDGPAAGSSYAQLVMSEDSTLAMQALVTHKNFVGFARSMFLSLFVAVSLTDPTDRNYCSSGIPRCDAPLVSASVCHDRCHCGCYPSKLSISTKGTVSSNDGPTNGPLVPGGVRHTTYSPITNLRHNVDPSLEGRRHGNQQGLHYRRFQIRDSSPIHRFSADCT